ncbi:MAG: FHA domain-containing protein [Planctomycetes bacterium]|nr:FHA domain-containing protein [Planctomycetota bacterium]
MPILSIFLVMVGVIVLLVFAGLVAYILFFYGKGEPATQASSPPPVIPPMITMDVEDEPDIEERTWDPGDEDVPDLKARLVVVEGSQVLSQSDFDLYKSDMKIGRNTQKEALNDIHIEDKMVSRSHAEIIHRDQKFFIRDLKSTAGTKVNDDKIKAFEDRLLQNGDEIAIGSGIKLKFEAINLDPEVTLDEFSQDEFRTVDFDEDETRYN